MRRSLLTASIVFAVVLRGTPAATHQHGHADGHLPPVQRNVEVVGRLDLVGDDQSGHISDVSVYGNYAYLGAYWEPDCREGGVYVVDISDPGHPETAGFIPTSPQSYVGEGVQVFDVQTAAFSGQVLVHSNETCGPDGYLPAGRGGVSLWDVTDPRRPQPLALHVGDLDPVGAIVPHDTHSAFGWQQGDRAYIVMTDNQEFGATDVDILDVTDPRAPVLVAETGLSDFPDAAQQPPLLGNHDLSYLHDIVVRNIGGRWLLLGSYWDAGMIVLDVTALPAKPVLVTDTDYPASEPLPAAGFPSDLHPEGNAHQAEFSHDGTLVLGTEEDFWPTRLVGTVTSGRYAQQSFTAVQSPNTPQIDEANPVDGHVSFVGDACAPLLPTPMPGSIALVERGTCQFQVKLLNVEAAGYRAGVVFNAGPACESAVPLLFGVGVFVGIKGSVPFAGVPRSAGLKLLGREFDDPCTTPSPPAGTPASDVRLRGLFDGWGYLNLYDTATMQVLDRWRLPEAGDPSLARGRGFLSIHEVATDPAINRAYISHYAGGFRVVDFDRESGIREVGAFIDQDGSQLWGVEVHRTANETLVLASDRDSGLWIFRPL